jgi:hypothetical protein
MKSALKAAVVGTTMAVAALAAAGTAQAQIIWTKGALLIDHQTGGCLAGNLNTKHASMVDCGSIADLGAGWELVSGQPDTAGYANVLIKNWNNPNLCLVALEHFSGPSQISGSSDVEMAQCNAGDPSQIWAMTTAAPRSGITAHLNFFTFGQRVCLDGGIGVYGFPESGCNNKNTYQEWDYDHAQVND